MEYWIWISLIPNLGYHKLNKLLEKYQTIERLYQVSKKELLTIQGIGEKIAENITNEERKKQVRKHMKYMENYKIDLVTIKDEDYPPLLKQIYDPPIMLYVKGNKEVLKQTKNMAIIGCRQATSYGEKAANYFAYQLAKNNITIVSGLAKGIDSFAHIGTLAAKGKTVAVIGNGLDNIYPKENSYLANQILQRGGAIVSEYPLWTPANKLNFPARNRIISGISKGVIVVEAKKKSGTLITVDFALEQGRDVYVVPGNINSENSVGTNGLIKQGAKLISHYTECL